MATVDMKRLSGYLLVALTALAFGFLLASQLRAELIPSSNRVARNEALVRSVQDLEKSNTAYRKRISELRREVSDLESQAAQRSESDRRLEQELAGLRVHAGLSRLHGPGVVVDLAHGRPGPDPEARTAYLINFQDIQDVVNLLLAGGAEGISVNDHRISPLTSYRGSGGTILIDQGPPLKAPFHVVAVGNRSEMEQLLGDPASLGDLRLRQRKYQIQFSWIGTADIAVPAYDSSLQVAYARAE
jgi:uncharacterized protein YlxW (UPF0749 family)